MDGAAGLLRDWSMSVKQVALEIGYHDTARFDSDFGRRYGCTPTAWREANSPRGSEASHLRPRPALGLLLHTPPDPNRPNRPET
jgi:AraC-like DNA-binding protein